MALGRTLEQLAVAAWACALVVGCSGKGAGAGSEDADDGGGPETKADGGGVSHAPSDAGHVSDATTATCSDGIRNGTETDVDCGGTCAPCADGGDAGCVGPSCVPVSPTPTDSVQNDSETDIDCGGAFNADGSPNPSSDGAAACSDGKRCASSHDCTSGVCTNAVCQAPSPSDGVMNDSETDVDCGGKASPTTDGASACGDNLHCLVATDCTSAICTGAMPASGGNAAVAGTCAAPSCSDHVKNGAETDTDCGGGSCSACTPGLACKVSGDCGSHTCNYNSVCAWAPSCANQNGGDTCGPGEVGDANATHEDCCMPLAIPRPAASGGPIMMDKYLITAGRMRAFLESVNYDVQTYITNHKPAWWPTGSTATTWIGMLPTNHDDFTYLTSAGSSAGCVVGSGKGAIGAPAFWEDAATLARDVSGAPRTYTQAQMDTKVMNCFHAPLFHALCAYDGGRLPSLVEWTAARTEWDANGVATVRTMPWASDGAGYNSETDRATHAVYNTIHNGSYAWPNTPTTNDYGGFLGAPGRFPSGNGPYGHSDLTGSVENMGSKPSTGGTIVGDGWFQFSFQEPEQKVNPVHPYGEDLPQFGTGGYEAHWAVGARCVKLP